MDDIGREATFHEQLKPHVDELMTGRPARAADVDMQKVRAQVCSTEGIDISQGITDSARVWRAIVNIWRGSSLLVRLRTFMCSGLRLLAAQEKTGVYPTSGLEQVEALDDEICAALQQVDATDIQLARELVDHAMDYLPYQYEETEEYVRTADMCLEDVEFIPALGSPSAGLWRSSTASDMYVPPAPGSPPPAYGDAWQFGAFVHDPEARVDQ